MTVKLEHRLTSKKRLFLRLFFWSVLFALILFCLNIPVWSGFTPKVFFALLLPYLICLWGYLVLADFAKRSSAYLMYAIGLAILFSALSQYLALRYVYELLPKLDIVLFVKPIDGYPARFFTRAATGNIVLALMASVDYMYWDKLMLHLRLAAEEKKAKRNYGAYHLSVHFIKNLLAIVRKNSLQYRDEIFLFFQYVFKNNHRLRTMVSLGEEWENVSRLRDICVHRRFVFSGQDALSEADWNRSVPALGLLTWMENAIQYSPDDLQEPIVLHWTKFGYAIQLCIVNAIAAPPVGQELKGKGLALMEMLLDEPQYQVRYEQTITNKFKVVFDLI